MMTVQLIAQAPALWIALGAMLYIEGGYRLVLATDRLPHGEPVDGRVRWLCMLIAPVLAVLMLTGFLLTKLFAPAGKE